MSRATAPNIVLILLLSASALTSALPGPKAPLTGPINNTNYEIYIFAAEYAGSVCIHMNCSVNFVKKRHFNMHGLWPEFRNGSWPQFCSQTPLDFLTLAPDVRDLLNEYWSGLFNSQQKFLTHEWEKHGTCWKPDFGNINKMPTAIRPVVNLARDRAVQNPTDFLELVVTLLKDVYPFYRILTNGGIQPSNTKRYTLAEVRGVIAKKLGVSGFAVQCYKQMYIETIYLCLDRDFQPTDGCDKIFGKSCGDEVIFPVDIIDNATLAYQ